MRSSTDIQLFLSRNILINFIYQILLQNSKYKSFYRWDIIFTLCLIFIKLQIKKHTPGVEPSGDQILKQKSSLQKEMTPNP